MARTTLYHVVILRRLHLGYEYNCVLGSLIADFTAIRSASGLCSIVLIAVSGAIILHEVFVIESREVWRQNGQVPTYDGRFAQALILTLVSQNPGIYLGPTYAGIGNVGWWDTCMPSDFGNPLF